jgi:hypothetical protein
LFGTLRVQAGEHDSAVDARTVMRPYLKVRDEWEREYGK